MAPYKIYSDSIDGKAIAQFFDALSQPWVVRGALMPDAHAGYSLPIGAVVATEGKVVPAWVGYDQGCGVCAIRTTFDKAAVIAHKKEIFDAIYARIPVGFSHHAQSQKFPAAESMPKSEALKTHLKKKGMTDLFTLGGSNHFLEVGFDEEDRVWLVTHSGSRGLGHSMATHYMKIASGDGKAREGHYALDEDSPDGQDYITDLAFCLAYALENRRGMLDMAGEAIRATIGDGRLVVDSLVNRNHNHAEKKGGIWIHRKGATHAEDGMLGIIPGCMRDGSFVVRGKGNPDSLFSSSHGAGRVMGRAEAKRTLDMETFRTEMAARGIEARIDEGTLDESAGAYKNIFEVMAMQRDLVEVIHHIKPLISIKG